jgi:hypothetical protein
MRAESSQYKFNINPAKSIFILQLILASLSFLLVAIISALFWVKVFTMLLIGVFGLMAVAQFRAAGVHQLSYRAASNQWFHNGCMVRLRPDQLITRNLVIVYFMADSGKKLTQLVPADSMPPEQHRHLRKLLIQSLHAANRDKPPHPAQRN